jgi:hypothetical protein
MQPDVATRPSVPDVLIATVARAFSALPDSASRDVLREALFAVTSSRDPAQLRTRLTLLASLVVELFRCEPPRALSLLAAIDTALDSVPRD